MDNALLPNLFFDKESSDVQLCIDTTADCREMVVPAHNLVLRTSSKVFRTMLETENFKEGRTGIMKLKVNGDMDDAILFLRYLYTGKLEHVYLSSYISLLQTADLYDVEHLATLCGQRIVDCVTPLTVCKVLGSLEKVAPENLLAHCRKLMLNYAFLIFKKDLHLSLSEETMTFLLKDDKLNVLDEEQALGALWRWGCARCALENSSSKGIEQMIANLLPLIRRPLIKNILSSSRWFGVWKDYISAKETSESKPSSDTRVGCRNPDLVDKATIFAQVARLTKVADKGTKRTVGNKNTSIQLLLFSMDRDILLSGFSVRMTGSQSQLGIGYGVRLNQEDITHLLSVKEELINEYTSRKITREQCSDTMYMSQLKGGQISVADENFYLFDILFELNTPIVLLQNQCSHSLELISKSDPGPGTCSSSYSLSQNSPYQFNRNLNLRVLFHDTAIRELYYFI